MKNGFSQIQHDIELTRLENCSTPGIPDVLMMDHGSRFHLIELKAQKGNVVKLSPHQVSFSQRHGSGNSWILIKKLGKTAKDYEVLLFEGKRSIELADRGCSAVPTTYRQSAPIDYDNLYRVMFHVKR